MTDEKSVYACQRETKRLRAIVRDYSEEIQRLREILKKTVSYMLNNGLCEDEVCNILGIAREVIA